KAVTAWCRVQGRGIEQLLQGLAAEMELPGRLLHGRFSFLGNLLSDGPDAPPLAARPPRGTVSYSGSLSFGGRRHSRHRRQATLQVGDDLRAVVAGVLDEDAVGPAAGLEGAGDVEARDVRFAGLRSGFGDQRPGLHLDAAAALEVGVRLIADQYVGGLGRQQLGAAGAG